MMRNLKTSLLLIILCAFIVSGCSTVDKLFANDEELTSGEVAAPAEKLYNEAAAALDNKKYVEATRLFEEVERKYPYSEWAIKAELMAAFSSYKDLRYDEAVLSLDRFIELHPGNKEIDYASFYSSLGSGLIVIKQYYQ